MSCHELRECHGGVFPVEGWRCHADVGSREDVFEPVLVLEELVFPYLQGGLDVQPGGAGREENGGDDYKVSFFHGSSCESE